MSLSRLLLTVVTALTCLSAPRCQNLTLTYDLQNVWLRTANRGSQQMTGTFTWTYPIGDIENGTGKFTSIHIPWWGTRTFPTYRIQLDHKEIEITLVGNYHGYGLDLKLAFAPLSRHNPSPLDLTQSKFDIQGRKGTANSGAIIPRCPGPISYGSGTAGSGGFGPILTNSGLPNLGNRSFRLNATRMAGGAPSFLLFGPSRATVRMLDVTVLVDPVQWLLFPMRTSGTPGQPGVGTLAIPVPVPKNSAFVGAVANFQVVAIDPGATAGQASASNGLTVEVCR